LTRSWCDKLNKQGVFCSEMCFQLFSSTQGKIVWVKLHCVDKVDKVIA